MGTKIKPSRNMQWHILDRRLAMGTVALMIYFAIAAGTAWLLEKTPVNAAKAPPAASPLR